MADSTRKSVIVRVPPGLKNRLAREVAVYGKSMGDRALAFLNGLDFPLSQPIEEKPGELQRFTPATQALVTPDIDDSLDEQPAKTRFWNAFKGLGPWWADLPPY